MKRLFPRAVSLILIFVLLFLLRAAVPTGAFAQEEEFITITGRVTRADTGEPLDGAEVSVCWNAVKYCVYTASVWTSADGYYTLFFEPTRGNSYYIISSTYSNSAYDELSPTFWPNASLWWEGDDLHLAPGATVTGIDMAMVRYATVGGVVRADDGGSVEGVKVQLWIPQVYGAPIGLAATQVLQLDGNYEFRIRPKVDYMLSFSGSGFFDEFWDGGTDYFSADPVYLQPGASLAADVELVRTASLEGSARAPGNLPFSAVAVYLYRVESGFVQYETGTGPDTRGKWVLEPLRAGDYVLEVAPRHLDSPFDGVFYPGVKSASEAEVISLDAGEHVAGLDIQLPFKDGLPGMLYFMPLYLDN